jgi:hypothetical protein
MVVAIRTSERGRARAWAWAPMAFAVAGALASADVGSAQTLQPISSEPGSDGCGAFAWPVSNERAWFADQNLRRGASGLRLSRIDRAVRLNLQPTRSIQFFLPPRLPPRPDTYSGEVTFFGVPHPGVYQVSISRDASIDVFDNGMRLAPVASTEAKDCDGVRKSARFALAPGDLVLVEVSGAAEPSIKVAFEEAP